MGEVYRARDSALKRDVAIKVHPASLSGDHDRLHRFQLEAEAAAALNHSNILSIFAIGQQDGSPYIVTELLEGETLRDRLRRGALKLRDAIDVAIQTAKGLAAAHEKGIAHRDLKPENLFITKDGRVKILDFGLAKLSASQNTSGQEVTVTQQTSPGTVMGTVGYMSPEQVRGNNADHRSDIFALGTIICEMVTGKQIFRKPTSAETMSAILNDDPPSISQITPAAYPGLQRVVHRCLEKNPGQRFQSASDLAFALDALSETGSSAVKPFQQTRMRPRLLWGGAILLLAALCVAWYLGRRSGDIQSFSKPSSLEVRTLTETGKTTKVAISQDGRYVAYVKKEAGRSEIRLLQVATERDVQVLPATALAIRNLHFSPDGNFLYFLQQSQPEDSGAANVFRIATLGGPAVQLATDIRTTDDRNGSVTVSPDGKQIAFIDKSTTESLIVSVEADGSNRRILARRPLERAFWFVEWSPKPERLAAVAIGDDDMGMVSIELPSGSVHDLSVTGWAAVGQPAWSADGSTIFAPAIEAFGSIMQIWAFNAGSGEHRALTSSSSWFLQFTLSSSANGDLVGATLNDRTALWVSDGSGHNLRLLPSLKGEGSDGVAWVGAQFVTSNMIEMLVHSLDGQNPTKLRSSSSIYRNLARCGPDKIGYWASDPKRRSYIARTDIATGMTVALTDGPEDSEPSCTADGSILVFSRCTKSGGYRCRIVRKHLKSGETSVLYDPGNGEVAERPMLSPDGSHVFFIQKNTKDPYDWGMMLPITGGTPQRARMPVSEAEVWGLRWAPDGKSLLYFKSDKGVANIWSAPISGNKPPRRITNFESDLIFAFDVSPDNRVIISRGESVRDVVLIKNVK